RRAPRRRRGRCETRKRHRVDSERRLSAWSSLAAILMLEPSLIIAVAVVFVVLLLTAMIVTTFLRSVDAGEILLASRGRNLRIFRGPCKALIVPVICPARVIPAQAI